MQAIQTKYLSPTNHRGSRIKAWCAARRLVVPWDHALDPEANHQAAALKLQVLMGWAEKNYLVGGVIPNGDYAWVQLARGGTETGRS